MYSVLYVYIKFAVLNSCYTSNLAIYFTRIYSCMRMCVYTLYMILITYTYYLYNFVYTILILIYYTHILYLLYAYICIQNRLTEASSNLYTIQDNNDHQSNGPPSTSTSTSTSDVRTRVLGPSDTDRDVSTTACIIQQYIYNILLYLSHPLLDLRMAALTLTGMYKCI